MAIHDFDMRLFKIFVAIVEAGGFAAAQGELNLSLSTISNHISALESRLNIVLCRRGRSGFRLTDEGRAVYDEVKRLLSTIDHFDGRMRSIKHCLTGTLSVGLIDNTITDPTSALNRVFARFTEEAPEAALSIVTRPPHELLRDVVTGELHVAISSFPRTTLGLNYTNLYSETQQFYCGKAHPLFLVPDDQIDLDAIKRYDLIARDYWNARDLKIFSVATPRATVSDMEAGARLVLSGRYLGYLPCHYADRYVESGDMRSICANRLAYKTQIQVASQKSQSRAGLLPFFMQLLAAEFSISKGREVTTGR